MLESEEIVGTWGESCVGREGRGIGGGRGPVENDDGRGRARQSRGEEGRGSHLKVNR